MPARFKLIGRRHPSMIAKPVPSVQVLFQEKRNTRTVLSVICRMTPLRQRSGVIFCSVLTTSPATSNFPSRKIKRAGRAN